MSARFFLDSNVVIYSVTDTGDKRRRATDLLARVPCISIQVVNETMAVLRRKWGLEDSDLGRIVTTAFGSAELHTITLSTVRRALEIAARYRFSYYDALIAASALEAGCQILYSEDLQHGQLLEDSLRIINPFLTTDVQAP